MTAQPVELNTPPSPQQSGAAGTDPYPYLDKLLYTIEEACDLLTIGRTTMFALLKEGTMPSVQIGRSRRIPRQGLITFMQSLADDSQ